MKHTQAATDVIAERARQVEGEGRRPEQDDQYTEGQLAEAASSYAIHATLYTTEQIRKWDTVNFAIWPWNRTWWKPTTRRRNLVKAAALLLAEIERLDRAYVKETGDVSK